MRSARRCRPCVGPAVCAGSGNPRICRDHLRVRPEHRLGPRGNLRLPQQHHRGTLQHNVHQRECEHLYPVRQHGPRRQQQSLAVLSYRQYLNALTAGAQASANTIQIAAVKALNNLDTTLYGTDSVVVPSALAAALGIAGTFGLTADGMTFCTAPGTAGCYHGIITITNEAGVLYYRSGAKAGTNTIFTLPLNTRPTKSRGPLRVSRHHRVWRMNVRVPTPPRWSICSAIRAREIRS